MHFVDRKKHKNAPLLALTLLHAKEQPKWLAYKAKTRKSTPSNEWRPTTINSLPNLFYFNCGYCGIYTDTSNDGEVDHHLPIARDHSAIYVYDWSNYVWACHSCNNKKRNNYPVLNPCCSTEMNAIYFHAADGRYLYLPNTSQRISDIFDETIKWTFMNGKNRPASREVFFKQLNLAMDSIKSAYFDFYLNQKLKLSTHAEQIKLNATIDTLKDLLKPKNYLFLAQYAVKKYKSSLQAPEDFPYTFKDFL